MAYIKTSELRSDGINVKVHIQKLENGGKKYIGNKAILLFILWTLSSRFILAFSVVVLTFFLHV